MNAKQQKIYELYLETPHGVLPTGSTLRTAYKRGLAGFYANGGGYDRTSLAYAAWLAGRKNARRGAQR